MDAFFIVAAIFLSVILLFKYAVPIGKPKISAGERMSDSALKQRFALLGKECRKVKRGFGMYYGNFDIGKRIGRIERRIKYGAELFDWERVMYDNRDMLIGAFDKALEAVRISYTLGHVFGNCPRLFVLCSEIVRCCNGDLTANRTEIAVKAFEKHAPLNTEEKKYMPNMLLFCLCGFLCINADAAFKYNKMYEKGAADGKIDKLDLDEIKNIFYVNGLIDNSVNVSDTISVLESNGINVSDAVICMKKFSAEVYAIAKAVVQSLDTIYEKASIDVSENRVSDKPKKFVAVFNIIPGVLTLIVSILICIFADEKFAALVFVSAIIFYGCFRLPVLLYSPQSVFDVFRYFKKSNKVKQTHLSKIQAADSEIAYFGVHPEYSVNMICGDRLNVTCDNKGKINLLAGQTDEIDMIIEVDGKKLRLAEFYGIHARNKSVYRLISSEVDFLVEFTVPVNYACCCARITALNRGNTEKSIRVINKLITEKRGEQYFGSSIAAVINTDSAVGITSDNDVVYDIIQESRLGIVKVVPNSVCAFTLMPYTKHSELFCVAYGSSIGELTSVFDCVKSDGFIDYAYNEAYAYGGECPVSEANDFVWIDNDEMRPDAKYATPKIPKRYLEDGMDNFSVPKTDGSVGVLHGGGLSVEFYKSSVGAIYDTESKKRMPCGENTFILFGENGVIWSPFSALTEIGNKSVCFGYGVVTYCCAYNGCLCVAKCSVATDAEKTMLIDVSVENATADAREIDVMFSARAQNGSRIVSGVDKLVVMSEDIPFNVFCSREISEYADCEESWLIRGRSAKTSGFSLGGSTPAAVASVKLNIEPRSTSSLSFWVTFENNDFIDKTVSFNETFFKSINKIDLLSSDKRFNMAYKRALYAAYMGGLLSGSVDCAVLCCGKYADPVAVRSALVKLLSEQKTDGNFISESGMSVCYSVVDYILYSGDFGFLSVSVPFLPFYSNGKRNTVYGTVKEHCSLYLDLSSNNSHGESYKRAVYERMRSIVYGFFARIYKYDRERSNLYMQKYNAAAIEHCRQTAEILNNPRSRFKSECDALIYAAALYYGGKFNEAYSIISTITDKLFSEKYSSVCNDNAKTNAVFYLIVTELIIGMRFYGKRVKINPGISDNCPHMEVRLDNGENNVKIVIDASEKNGDWRTRIGRIYYSENNIAIDGTTETVILYRDGTA